MAKATVYLLHLDPPYKHARHYVGWTGRDLDERLDEHRGLQGRALGGKGSALLAAQNRVGGSWRVARTWTFRSAAGAKQKERAIKHRAATRQCPICQAAARLSSGAAGCRVPASAVEAAPRSSAAGDSA